MSFTRLLDESSVYFGQKLRGVLDVGYFGFLSLTASALGAPDSGGNSSLLLIFYIASVASHESYVSLTPVTKLSSELLSIQNHSNFLARDLKFLVELALSNNFLMA